MAVNADAVAVATESCPGVARLSSGRFSEVATYLPGRRVIGVRATEDELEVHVVAEWETSLPLVAEEVRAIVSPLSEGLPVGVYVDDIDVPASLMQQEEPPELPPAGGASDPTLSGEEVPGDLG